MRKLSSQRLGNFSRLFSKCKCKHRNNVGKESSPNIFKYFIPRDGMPSLFLGAVVAVRDMEGGQSPWWLESGNYGILGEFRECWPAYS